MKSFFRNYFILKKSPKGYKISYPDKLIFVCKINPSAQSHLTLKNNNLYLSRLSLKHIAEKQNDILVKLIQSVCYYPDEMRRSKVVNRYLLVKYFREYAGRPYVVCIEIVKNKKPVVVTAFMSDDKYLSNFDLLWRTGVS